MRFIVQVLGKSYNVDFEEQTVTIKGKKIKLENYRDGSFEFIIGGKCEKAVLLRRGDNFQSFYEVYTHNLMIPVTVESENIRLAYKILGVNKKNADNKSFKIFAPMPGYISKIFVGEGEHVASGDSLCILEAMKMENILRSKQTGTIAKCYVTEYETVEKDKLLFEIS